MNSNTLVRAAVRRRPAKRLRRCLNPACYHIVGTGKIVLDSTRVGEYARLECTKCGAVHVLNPVGRVTPHASKDIFVACDSRRGVEHLFPKARVP